MKLSPSKKTLAGAVASLCVMAAVPALSASAATGSTSASQVAPARHTAGTTSWTYTGTYTDSLGQTQTAVVKIQPQKFIKSGSSLLMRSLVTATANGQTASKTIDLPVKSINTGGAATSTQALAATCDVLNLDLGPLDLNLLGLQIHLNEVVLNITAVSGAGNLLGNLLCAVAGLLDNTGLGGALGTLTGLLNQILAVLNGLGV